MIFYLVRGMHPVVPGEPAKLFASMVLADAFATTLVANLSSHAMEMAEDFVDDGTIAAEVAKLHDTQLDASNWRAVLEATQRALLMMQRDATPEDIEQGLVDLEDCDADVWIDEFDVELPVAEIAVVVGEQGTDIITRGPGQAMVYEVRYADEGDAVDNPIEIGGDVADLTVHGPSLVAVAPVAGFWEAIDGRKGGA